MPNATAYLAHRADLITTLGPRLEPGDEVLDLACGDGGLGELLLARGLRYRGVDSTPEMVAEAQRRLGSRAPVELGDLNGYAPPSPVAATTIFRAIYYAMDRRAFFEHVAAYTEKKLVFDLNPRQYRPDDVVNDLRAAGFGRVILRPFFIPQTIALPRHRRHGCESARAFGAARAARASSPLHLRRRGISLAEERLEVDVEHASKLTAVALRGVDLVWRERRCHRHLDAPRDARSVEKDAVGLAVLHDERPRFGGTPRSPVACRARSRLGRYERSRCLRLGVPGPGTSRAGRA